MNQHYLHEMFALDEDRRCKDSNAFMEMEISVPAQASAALAGREGPGEGQLARRGVRRSGVGGGDGGGDEEDGEEEDEVTFIGDVDSPVSSRSMESSFVLGGGAQRDGAAERNLKVKNLSRLWLYRNGGVPPDEPVRRAATA